MHPGAADHELLGRQRGKGLAQLVRGGDEEVLDVQDRLGARFDRARSGVAQHADRFDDPVTALGLGGRLAGEDTAGGGFGVAGVVLAAVAAADAGGASDFDDVDALQAQRARQAGAEGAGPFHAGVSDRAAALGPSDQRPVTTPRRRERLGGQEAAERIDEHRGVRVAVCVDAEDDLALEA